MPENPENREPHTKEAMSEILDELGFTSDNYGMTYLFSTVNRYYRVSLRTQVGRSSASLEALIEVPRHEDTRAGNKVTVHWMTLR